LTEDADTGFGGPINAARTVAAYERVGIAALHIEDQGTHSPPKRVLTSDFPKRCGHLLGKKVCSREEYKTRIRAAALGKSKLPSAPLIIAR
jgi:2-methylisocitrate lyase-like PEP mutase family enzyme